VTNEYTPTLTVVKAAYLGAYRDAFVAGAEFDRFVAEIRREAVRKETASNARPSETSELEELTKVLQDRDDEGHEAWNLFHANLAQAVLDSDWFARVKGQAAAREDQ